MKSATIILGYQQTCIYCGQLIQKAIIPVVNDSKWVVIEPLDDSGIVALHDCPEHPRNQASAERPSYGDDLPEILS
jgi:hypothetical protein